MITAIILAAGRSTRMGRPKMLLPWGNITVLGKVIETIKNAEVDDIIVITGGAREEVEQICGQYSVRDIHNDDFAKGEMLSSIQCGLQALAASPDAAALIVLGDQPQIRERSVKLVCAPYREKESPIVVPSYSMRRGHPWLVASPLWAELLAMKPSQSPRDFLNIHAVEIEYIEVDTPSIVEDLDTPEDYLKFKP